MHISTGKERRAERRPDRRRLRWQVRCRTRPKIECRMSNVVVHRATWAVVGKKEGRSEGGEMESQARHKRQGRSRQHSTSVGGEGKANQHRLSGQTPQRAAAWVLVLGTGAVAASRREGAMGNGHNHLQRHWPVVKPQLRPWHGDSDDD